MNVINVIKTYFFVFPRIRHIESDLKFAKVVSPSLLLTIGIVKLLHKKGVRTDDGKRKYQKKEEKNNSATQSIRTMLFVRRKKAVIERKSKQKNASISWSKCYN